MSSAMDRVVRKYEGRHKQFFGPAGPAFAIRDPSGRAHVIGSGAPEFTFSATDEKSLRALATLDSLVIAESYL